MERWSRAERDSLLPGSPKGSAGGRWQNRIKEQQLGLFSDRTPCHAWWAKQFRVLLSAAAYVLMETIRRIGLAGTDLARAQMGTIRLKLLKVGTVIVRNCTCQVPAGDALSRRSVSWGQGPVYPNRTPGRQNVSESAAERAHSAGGHAKPPLKPGYEISGLGPRDWAGEQIKEDSWSVDCTHKRTGMRVLREKLQEWHEWLHLTQWYSVNWISSQLMYFQ